MVKRILFQGDSITDCGRSRERDDLRGYGYASMVSGVLGMNEPEVYEFINRGISGNRVVDLYARIKKDMINLQPDFMSILIGVNDVWHEYGGHNGVSAEKFEMVYGLLIEELQQALPELKIMILEPFVLPGSATVTDETHPDRWEWFAKEVPLRAAAAARIAEKYGLVFVPLQASFDRVAQETAAGYWLHDGVHPTAMGHELIKRAWLAGFEELNKL